MSEVALFDDMKLLHIDSLSDIVSRITFCSYDTKLQLEAVMDTISKDIVKVYHNGAERTVTLPGVELIFSVDAWDANGTQTVKYNGKQHVATHVEAYGLHAILCSGEIVCILPECIYKETNRYER